MQVGGINNSASLLQTLVQQQVSTNVLSKANNAQGTQGEASVAAIATSGDEAEQNADGDERGGRFETIA